jgi:hypothetical protein
MEGHIRGQKNMKRSAGDQRRDGVDNVDAMEHEDRRLGIRVWRGEHECRTIGTTIRLVSGAVYSICNTANLDRNVGVGCIDCVGEVCLL